MVTRKTSGKSIEAFTHEESRVNIPTEELSAFVREDEETPSTMLYPRDASLDPQLVWKGKDEQDRDDLAVPVAPIYIQEKIHPQAIIDDLRKRSRTGGVGEAAALYDQIDFFADFNGIEEFSDRIDFYQHEQHWSNRMILGDSLYVMTSLAEKEGLKGKVQTIYLDPPYGIKFGSNWQVSTRKRDVKDGSATDATRQPEQVRAFRDTWKLGIHSYLSYLRDRLTVARELLTESGSLFVQIGDENVHLVRSVLDEVFGSENFVSLISFAKTTGFSGLFLSNVSDYIVWYSKNLTSMKYRQLHKPKEAGEAGATAYRPIGELPVDQDFWKDRPPGLLATSDQLTSQGAPAGDATFTFHNRRFHPPAGLHWKTTTQGMARLASAGRVFLVGNTLRYLRLFNDFPVYPITSTWTDTGIAGFTADRTYVVQTLPKVIERCILMTTDPGDLVLDPTCGSGTTAYVAEQWGRRWITIDTSRVALALARTRLMAGRFPYYLLADSVEGRRKEAEVGPLSGFPSAEGRGDVRVRKGADLRKGFVYKQVPHVTLKSIANNPDIKEGMTRAEIDAAIARHADTETLYDQPYEDSKVVRVTGPFTVESLSPHRVLDPSPGLSPLRRGEENDPSPALPFAEGKGEIGLSGEGDFVTMILDNLRKAGVQNTYKGERIVFDRLDAFPGKTIAARGEFTDANGGRRTVAVTIGPELGTVGKEQIKEAAIEAMKGAGVDVLLVCGFAFDGAVSEEAKQYGVLTVLPTRMNPDLAMDELLKKTGAGNLFMIFGEPDVEIRETGDALVVEIRGVDVYDPTTGEIRSNSTDDIACWFIDTDYNEESFFVRHAYFTGAHEPYDKLKRVLRAEIDEAAWSSLYSTVSFPFDRPQSGKIGVKVINHYGDEVLKVIAV